MATAQPTAVASTKTAYSFKRGSEWRKWDLHVHTPGTKKNDQYVSDTGDVLDIFCDRIEASDVCAVGITDYFSVDCYFRFIQRFKEKYPHSAKVFFPNVELCTSDVVNAASEEVNIHLIFNPFLEDCEKNVTNFLRQLDTNKTRGAGGQRVKASELKTQADFQEATTTRDLIKKAFNDTFGDKAELTDYVLILAAANNDGIRAATEEVHGKRRGKKRKALISDEVDKFSHGFFGNTSNTEYFLTVNRLEDGSTTSPKPVVSGSDAHSFNDLDRWLGKVVLQDGVRIKEATWIKADLTFEGLKQIIFEPADRVFIGEEPDIERRVRENKRRYISALHIDQIPGYDERHGTWFKAEEIELNKELVAIIGNKGNGKSALTDTIGLLGNSHNQKYEREAKKEELLSFLNKDKFLKGNCASNFVGQLHWYAGPPDEAQLDTNTDTTVPENVEYLPQKYLEKICANIEDDEFRHKLNEVIFEYVKENDRYGQNTLDDLITYLSNQIGADIKIAKSTLHDANVKVVSLERRLTPDYKKELEEKLKLKQADIEAHNEARPEEKQKPVEGGEEAAKSLQEIEAIDKKLQKLKGDTEEAEVESSAVSLAAENLRQARQTIERHVNALTGLKSKFQQLLGTEGIAFEDVVSVTASYAKLDGVIATKEYRLRELDELLRDENDIDALDLPSDDARTAKSKSLICQKTTLDNTRKEITDKLDKPNREYQAYLAELSKWLSRQKALEGDLQNPAPSTFNWLKQELDTVTTKLPQELLLAKDARVVASKQVLSKKKSLIAFYVAVKRSIDDEIKKYGTDLGEYNISIEASLKFDQVFHDEFFRFVNQQVKGTFHGTEDGRAALQKLTDAVSSWEDETQVFGVLGAIDNALHTDQRDGQGDDVVRDIFKQMRAQKKEPVDLYDYMFGFDYLEAKYDLRIDGKDLRELSAGERGGLLLIFYLMLDRRDIPLVIDQPEDNLDNKSVYEILVTFLKKAKKRRQIILVTHNPNLAVVADAEQIIHVSIDKKDRKNDFTYRSGAIENPEINKAVVDILEGTLPAFDNRRLKYRKQIK
ncbi:MAG: TrlF family AAA-like ATPase [Candidatus Sulfotelmatobacter sp.]|jgi:ABC-type lipoprotein export system ATPase subunit